MTVLRPAAVAAAVTALVVLVLSLVLPDADGGIGLSRHPVSVADSPTPSAMATPVSTTQARPPITLEPTGLGVVGFGQPARVAIAILTDRLGSPDESAPERCRGGERSTAVRWEVFPLRDAINKIRCQLVRMRADAETAAQWFPCA